MWEVGPPENQNIRRINTDGRKTYPTLCGRGTDRPIDKSVGRKGWGTPGYVIRDGVKITPKWDDLPPRHAQKRRVAGTPVGMRWDTQGGGLDRFIWALEHRAIWS